MNQQMKNDLLEKFWIWLAWMLPIELVKWCFIRVATYASGTDEFAMVAMPDITCIDALNKWTKDH